jgi:hypothetical protein
VWNLKKQKLTITSGCPRTNLVNVVDQTTVGLFEELAELRKDNLVVAVGSHGAHGIDR